MSIPSLLQALNKSGLTEAQIAASLGVSQSTVHRWSNASVVPTPQKQAALFEFSRNSGIDVSNIDAFIQAKSFEDAVDATLRNIRESLHRYASFSTRNEALDFIAALFSAHTNSIRQGEKGIHIDSLDEDNLASSLRGFVVSRLASRKDGLDFSNSENVVFSIKDSETKLARELVSAFQRLSTELHLAESVDKGGDLLNLVFGRFLSDSFQEEKELGQYLTPTEVVQFMVDLALNDLTLEERNSLSSIESLDDFGYVLDPSCGVASFLAEFLRRANQQLGDADGTWISAAASKLAVGMDKSSRMIRLAKANLHTFNLRDGDVNLFLGNSLEKTNKSNPLATMDGKVGLILTNPPFGAEFSGSEIADFKLASSWSSKPPKTIDSELLFLERYIEWLRPGGQLLAVVPDSILTNKGIFQSLRNGLSDQVEIRSVISLPAVTFAAAGTATKTSILHLRKANDSMVPARFAVCESLGYSVSTRGSQRKKIYNSENQLPSILEQILTGKSDGMVRVIDSFDEKGRWDATYHATLPLEFQALIDETQGLLTVREIADISTRRSDPRKFTSPHFRYIEISDVDGETLSVSSKQVESAKAPSRARQVVSAGDILISTVRPERKAIGVVPESLEGAICSTGFVVLRTKSRDPYAIAGLLRTDFFTLQLLRNNVGIAYPTFEPSCLPDLWIPANNEQLITLEESAQLFVEAQRAFERAKASFSHKLSELTQVMEGSIQK